MDQFQLDKGIVSQTVSQLRATFNSGKTKPIEWRKEQLKQLKKLIEENSSTLEQAIKEDLGKSEIESRMTETSFIKGEIAHTLKKLKNWMKSTKPVMPLMLQPAAGKLVYEPLGVVLIIAPWNYPVMLLLSPLVGALAAGNSVLLKPSEVSPTVSKVLAELIPQYLDHDAVKILEGGAEATGLILEERFDHIFYTGNEHVARIVSAAAAKHLTPVTLELGGKSPVWIGEGVNLKHTADRIAWGKFINAGQTCVAPDYIVTTPDIADQLGKYFSKSIKKLYGKNPENNVDYCRIINEKHTNRLKGMLDEVNPEQILTGGEIKVSEKYIAPTVVDHVSLDSELMKSEIFGPILPIVRVNNFEEALDIILSKEKPLSLYAFTKNKEEKNRLLRDTSSGAIGFNIPVAHLSSPKLPFGGVGVSGHGNYHGKYSFITFSHLKPILSKPLWPDTMRFIYAPYGYMAKLVTKLFIGR
ncbi:MAG: aldehyde dehydrogenase family protein [Neisseriaceae bacterium]|nr:aldehyde dehydrogenase family protein [Neisseriaceae bacterium]